MHGFLATLSIFILTAVGMPQAGFADTLRIATWNIAHLKYSAATDSGGSRSSDDFDRLAEYARQLDADIIALQEVQNEAAAERVFGSDYRIFLSSRRHSQRVGFAVRDSVPFIGDPEDVDITGGSRVRYGVDLSVPLDTGQTLRLLAVHLKSFCFEKPLDSGSDDCQKLAGQVAPLESWIDARAQAGEAFIVLGDFNRRFDSERPSANGETFWRVIDDRMPARQSLERVTQFRKSACFDSRFPRYIDHIVLGPDSAGWVVPGSFKQVVYSEPYSERKKISDHCPIAIDIEP